MTAREARADRPAAPAVPGAGAHRAGGRRLRPGPLRRATVGVYAGTGGDGRTSGATSGATRGRAAPPAAGHRGRQQRRLPGHPRRLPAGPARAEPDRAHRLLDLAGRGAPGLRGAARRRVRHGAGRRRLRRAAARRRLPATTEGGISPGRALPAVRRQAPTARSGAAASGWSCSSGWPTRSPTATAIHAVILGTAVNNDGAGQGRLHRAERRRAGRGHRPGARRGRRRPAHASATSRRTAPAPRSATRSRSPRSPACSAADTDDARLVRHRLGEVQHRPPRRRRRRGRLIKTVLALEHGADPADHQLRAARTRRSTSTTARSTSTRRCPVGAGRRAAPGRGQLVRHRRHQRPRGARGGAGRARRTGDRPRRRTLLPVSARTRGGAGRPR